MWLHRFSGCSVFSAAAPCRCFQYLRSLGRSPSGLGNFCWLSDALFASRLAGTDLQHYYAWRRQNGYAVRSLPAADPQQLASSAGGIAVEVVVTVLNGTNPLVV